MSKNKVTIVTGAGSGVGRATSVLLATAGYDLVLVSRTEANLKQTAEFVSQQTTDPINTVLAPADLCDPHASRQIVHRALEVFGRIDALANIAGAAPLVAIPQITEELWRHVIDTNLSSVVHLTAAAWPAFEKGKAGVIVNVSSMASIDPFPRFSIYATAKAGLNMFTHSTALEGESIGVEAVCIAPGAIETPMLRANFDKAVFPTEKTLDPAEVAAVIRDCITGARTFKNGETIPLPSP